MRMSGTGTRFRIDHFLKLPLAAVDAETMEVVHTVKAVIPAKDVNLPVVHHGDVPISGAGRCIVQRQNFCPLVRLKVKLKEIISAVSTIVAAENVEIIVKGHRSVQRTRARGVVFVILLVVHFMPTTWLFQKVALCASFP